MPSRDCDICPKLDCADDSEWIALSLRVYLTAHQYLTEFTRLLKLRLPKCSANYQVLAPSGALSVTKEVLTAITQTEFSKRQLQRPGLFFDMFVAARGQIVPKTPGDIKVKVTSILESLQGNFDTEDLSNRIKNTLFLLEQIPSHMPSQKLQVLSLFLKEFAKALNPTKQTLARPLPTTQTKLVLNFVNTFIRDWGESRSHVHPCLKTCRFCENVINQAIREWGTLCCKEAENFYEVWQEWVTQKVEAEEKDDASTEEIETICASVQQWDQTGDDSSSSSCCDLLDERASSPDVSVCARYRDPPATAPADFDDTICPVDKTKLEWMEEVLGTGDFGRTAIKSPSPKGSETEGSSSNIVLAQAGSPGVAAPEEGDQGKVPLYRPLYRSQAPPDDLVKLTDEPLKTEDDQIIEKITPREKIAPVDVLPKTEVGKGAKTSLYREEPGDENAGGLRKSYLDGKPPALTQEENTEKIRGEEIAETKHFSLYREQKELTKAKEIAQLEDAKPKLETTFIASAELEDEAQKKIAPVCKQPDAVVDAARAKELPTAEECDVKENRAQDPVKVDVKKDCTVAAVLKLRLCKTADVESDVKTGATCKRKSRDKETCPPKAKKECVTGAIVKDKSCRCKDLSPSKRIVELGETSQSPTRESGQKAAKSGHKDGKMSDAERDLATTTKTKTAGKKTTDVLDTEKKGTAGDKAAQKDGQKASGAKGDKTRKDKNLEKVGGHANIGEESAAKKKSNYRPSAIAEGDEAAQDGKNATSKSGQLYRPKVDAATGEDMKDTLKDGMESKVKEDKAAGADKSRDTDDEEKLTRQQAGKKARADIAGAAAGEEMDELSKSKEAPGERGKKADASDSERRLALRHTDEEEKVGGGDGRENLGGAADDKLIADKGKKKGGWGATKKDTRLLEWCGMAEDDYSKINGPRNQKRKPALSKLLEDNIGRTDAIEYQLSDEHFVRLGWTVLPVTKSMRKIVQYEARMAKPHLDWFKKRKMDGTLFYGDGFSPFVQFHEDESGEVFYPNGRLAIKVHRPENRNYDMYTVFTPGGKDYLGIGRQPQILAVFDSNGTGALFNDDGDIRLSYNQIGGMCIDNPCGDPYAWLWSRQRKRPVTRTLCAERSITHLEKYLNNPAENTGKSGGSRKTGSSATSRNKEKKAAEQKPVVEDAEDEVASGSDFEEDSQEHVSHIKMICMKLNEYLSVRIIDRKNITLKFTSGHKSIKIHLGTVLNHKKELASYAVDCNKKYSAQENKFQNVLDGRVDSSSSLCEFSREMRKVKEFADERNRYLTKFKPFAGKLRRKPRCCKSC